MSDTTSYRVLNEKTNKKGQLTYDTLVTFVKLTRSNLDQTPLEIAHFLNNSKLVDGVVSDNPKRFLGAGCLAAQLIHVVKKEVGNVFIIPEKSINKMYEDYTFDIIVNDDNKTIMINAYENITVFFTGTPQEFINTYQK